MKVLVFRICFASAVFAMASAVIPPYIKVCNRNDPEINKCITNSIEQLRDKLRTGIPELDVPVIEPLMLDNLMLSRGPSSASFNANFTDILVYGPSTFKVHNLKVDVNKMLFTYVISFSKLEFVGKYSINARLLLIHLQGAGNMTGYFKDYNGDVIMKARKVHRDNSTYLHFDKMKFVININNYHINLDNLFNGDKILGKATNDILNDNKDLFLQEITPSLENALSKLFTDVANKITRSFTYDELFPNN